MTISKNTASYNLNLMIWKCYDLWIKKYDTYKKNYIISMKMSTIILLFIY